MGVDITSRVVSFGSLEQIKEVLLAVATMFTSENRIQVTNIDGAFSTDGPLSLMRGVEWYGQPLVIAIDGIPVYNGVVRNIELSEDSRIATITTDDVMKVPAQQPFIGSATGQNPGDALLTIARSVLDESYLDLHSFQAAGSPARSAGATIRYAFLSSGGGAGCMEAMQQIAELCSISVYGSRGQLTAAVFQPYQGNGSGLGIELNDLRIRQMPEHGFDTLNFFNRVTVPYPTALSITLDALDSQRNQANRIIRGKTLGDLTGVHAADRNSAIYFGDLSLKRASWQPRLCAIVVGPEVAQVELNDRFPLNSHRFGTIMPGEVYQVTRDPDRDETTI